MFVFENFSVYAHDTVAAQARLYFFFLFLFVDPFFSLFPFFFSVLPSAFFFYLLAFRDLCHLLLGVVHPEFVMRMYMYLSSCCLLCWVHLLQFVSFYLHA